MNDITIFYPQEADASTYWLVGITLVSVAILLYAIFYKHKVLSMVTGLVALILVGSTFLSWMSASRTSEVTIAKDYVETMYGKISFSEISKVYIEETIQGEIDKQLKKAQNRYLVIEKIGNGYPTALPAGVFQIDSIKMILDMKYRSWREEN